MSEVLGQGILKEEYAFSNLIDALRVASASARQIAYQRQQPDWFLIQSGLDEVREKCIELAVRKLI